MKFREDRGEIGATCEGRVLENAYLEGEEKQGKDALGGKL
jgi:hypothetical protein